jgi:hypothetical protein
MSRAPSGRSDVDAGHAADEDEADRVQRERDDDGALDRMTGSPVGQACVIIAFAMYAVGFVLIRRMSRIDV